MNLPRLTVLFALIFLFSCSKTIKLSAKELKWVPYKGNETLVFISNTGEADTIFLLGANRSASPTDPLAVFPTHIESYSILARHSDPSPPDGSHRYLENIFLTLYASTNKSPYLSFYFSAKDAWFYGGDYFKLNDLENMKPTDLETKAGRYKDVLILSPNSNEYFQRSNFITRIYWSKSNGLIRFDKKGTMYWELVKK
jgi:hypothetical protein